MAIKFGMTVADMIMQLTNGFMKATGRKPEALEKIKIQQEDVQRFRNMKKVVDMEVKTIDTSKGIMGGKQAKAMGGRIGLKEGENVGQQMRTVAPQDFNEKLAAYYSRSMPSPKTPTTEPNLGAPKGITSTDPTLSSRFGGSIFNFKNIEDEEETENLAAGGRIGYKLGSIDKARRAFLKTAAGVGGGIAALKTGLVGLGKQAGPAVEAVKETVAQAPSYFFDLVAKIKMLGKPGISIGPRQNTMNYKNYELMEDVSTGDIRITKQKGDPDLGYEEEVMEYRKGQRTEDGMIPDEYEEATIRPDMDGKMKDIEDGIEPDSIQEIIKEVTDEAPSIKKAGGGIARMLGE